ncbi:MAG: hypothetical protein HDR52_02795 [Treponema sp.]|nr:hypothetical protein [Treponema sp.]
MKCIMPVRGKRDMFFPKRDYDLNRITFSQIMIEYLESRACDHEHRY